jgi:hypothetical protein
LLLLVFYVFLCDVQNANVKRLNITVVHIDHKMKNRQKMGKTSRSGCCKCTRLFFRHQKDLSMGRDTIICHWTLGLPQLFGAWNECKPSCGYHRWVVVRACSASNGTGRQSSGA